MKYKIQESALPLSFGRAGIVARAEKREALENEREILQAVREGETEAFGKLASQYEDFVYTLVYGIVRSKTLAEDIAQETFLRAYRGIRRFELKSSFKTWLYRIAYNTSMSHLKREKANAEQVTDIEPEMLTESPANHSLRLTLENLISRLKPELRSVVIFHYYDDLKYEEIADVLGCPIGTVKIRLYRAKNELRKLWERYAV